MDEVNESAGSGQVRSALKIFADRQEIRNKNLPEFFIRQILAFADDLGWGT
jgi:hypothetical protein